MASTWQTLGNVFTVVRSIANKDSTTLPDATLLPLANKYYFLIIRELIGLNEDFYAEISNTDLVAGQSEYPLPVDDTASPYGGGAVKIHKVDTAFVASDWKVAGNIPFNDVRIPLSLTADISNNYSINYPGYYFKDRSVFLLPTPSSSDNTTAGNAGLYIYWTKRPGEVTSGSSIPDLPKDWLSVLQEGILYEVFRKYNKTTDARDALANFQIGVSRMRELEQSPDTGEGLNMKSYPKNYH